MSFASTAERAPETTTTAPRSTEGPSGADTIHRVTQV